MKKLILLACLACASAFAQSPTVYTAAAQSGVLLRIKPQAVPTSLTAVTSIDADVLGMVVINSTNSAINFIVQDGQGTPIPFFGTTSIAAHSTSVMVTEFGYWCPNGFSVQAGGAGLNYFVKWRQ